MAKSIPRAFVDELIARVDIVDVIDRRVPLTRKGREYMACCPFHDEKTPSFSVSPEKQFYHCFGCGVHGTVIGFLMDYANLGFVEAVEELADGVGMAVPSEQSSTTHTQPTNDLLTVVAQANTWFQQQLRSHSEAKKAIQYLKKRGLDGPTTAKFGLGFVPDSWNDLTLALGNSKLTLEQLKTAGLISQSSKRVNNKDDKHSYYDRFRNRIVFPIEDHRGRVVGFGGRVMDKGEPKYLNSPETPIFHKGAELYGLHRARRAIGLEGESIVVEGYMDVIGLAQQGIDNSVATLGTATTRVHLQRLFRLAPTIVFCFDGDRAGRAAAWKALQVVLPELIDGRAVRFLFLPDGEDPDSMVRKQGRQAFVEGINNALPLSEFLLSALKEQVDMHNMEGRARLVSLAKPLIERLPKGSFQDLMNKELSQLSGIAADRLQSASQSHQQKQDRLVRANLSSKGQISPLALLISLLLQNPQLANSVDERFPLEKLDIKGVEVFRYLVSVIQPEKDYTTAHLLEACRDLQHHDYLLKLASRVNSVDESALQKQFEDTLQYLFSQQVKQRIDFLLAKSRETELDANEKQELAELLKSQNVS